MLEMAVPSADEPTDLPIRQALLWMQRTTPRIQATPATERTDRIHLPKLPRDRSASKICVYLLAVDDNKKTTVLIVSIISFTLMDVGLEMLGVHEFINIKCVC
jgi:hypothetical protein